MGLIRQSIANFIVRLNGLGKKNLSGFQLSVESNFTFALVLFYYAL